MKVIVRKEVNYVEEANVLLFNYVNAVSYEKLKAEGRKTVTYSSELFEKRFGHIIKIYNYVTNHMKIDRSKLDFYFKEIGNSQMMASYYLLPIFNGNIYSSLNEYEAVAKNKSDMEVIKDFDFIISQYYRLGKSGDEEAVETFEDLARIVEKSDLPTEDKWKLIQIFIDRSRHLEELCQILKEVIQLIHVCQNDVKELEEDFYNYWHSYALKNDFIKEFQEHVKVTWEENPSGVFIIPSIFSPKMITVSIDVDEKNKEDIIHLGVLLDSNLSYITKQIDSEDLYNSLKLLSDKSKFEILKFIKDKPAYGFEIANELNLSTSTISYHMNALISANLVKLEKESNKIYYSMNKETLSEILEDIQSTLLL